MASQVTVTYKGYRETIKTTPALTLQTILEQVCKKFKINQDNYILAYKNKPVDLALPMRLSNLPAGAKLDLELNKGNGSSGNESIMQIPIALQFEDGTRLQDKFGLNTTLWDLLTFWESKGPYNLTRFMGQPAEAKKSIFKKFPDIYMQPVINLLSKELATHDLLVNTTLKQLGLNSSGGVLRFFFRETKFYEPVIPPIRSPLSSFTAITLGTEPINTSTTSTVVTNTITAMPITPTAITNTLEQTSVAMEVEQNTLVKPEESKIETKQVENKKMKLQNNKSSHHHKLNH